MPVLLSTLEPEAKITAVMEAAAEPRTALIGLRCSPALKALAEQFISNLSQYAHDAFLSRILRQCVGEQVITQGNHADPYSMLLEEAIERVKIALSDDGVISGQERLFCLEPTIKFGHEVMCPRRKRCSTSSTNKHSDRS